MKVSVIGAGYVGAVTAAGLASMGVQVHLYETDASRVNTLGAGKSHLFEPGLTKLLEQNLSTGRLHVHHMVWDRVHADALVALEADLTLWCVPTPPKADGRFDVSALEGSVAIWMEAFRAKGALPSPLMAIKSTVTPGTCLAFKQRYPEVRWVSNPEFLREGSAVQDFLHPERVVIGVFEDDAKSFPWLKQLYSPLCDRTRILKMSPSSAELSKLAANAMLATRLSAMHDIATLAELSGADVREIKKTLALDSRIGGAYLQVGPGFGGACLPKDLMATLSFAKENGVRLPTLMGVQETNNNRIAKNLDTVLSLLDQSACPRDQAIVAVWGVAFKAGTDDVRASASVALIEALAKTGIHVRVHDPAAKFQAQHASHVSWKEDPYKTLEGADVLVLMTDWSEYLLPQVQIMAKHMRHPNIFDTRNVWSHHIKAFSEVGITYKGHGIP